MQAKEISNSPSGKKRNFNRLKQRLQGRPFRANLIG
jgi:hypothetical protein